MQFYFLGIPTFIWLFMLLWFLFGMEYRFRYKLNQAKRKYDKNFVNTKVEATDIKELKVMAKLCKLLKLLTFYAFALIIFTEIVLKSYGVK